MKKISRRRFLEGTARLGVATGAAASLPLSLGAITGCTAGAVSRAGEATTAAPEGSPGLVIHEGCPDVPKVILVSIDSLDPRILDLDVDGERGGRDGDWLMPNVHRFLEEGTWFQHSRCHLPAATDMNHLNAIAGTTSAQTGILGVSIQFFDWNPDGTPNIVHTSLGYARDDKGRPVDTLFSAWKRRWPRSRTLYASGKGWVTDMYRTESSGVDLFLKGTDHPAYIPPSPVWSFYDPPGDEDAGSDPESLMQKLFCDRAYGSRKDEFPCDRWIAESSLKMLEREKPDLAMILLAEMDDSQHGLGAAVNPEDFELEGSLFSGKRWVHTYNGSVYREPVLDAMRDVDRQFGLFLEGLGRIPYYQDATIVLYSDHGHITHRETVWSNIGCEMETNPLTVLREAGVITGKEKDGLGLFLVGASSVGGLHVRGGSIEERRRRSREFRDALLAHTVWNEKAGAHECPWLVLGDEETRAGVPGICEPGELYHPHFADGNAPGQLHWPDLALFMRNGWQLPVGNRLVSNLGARLPWYLPDNINLFLGGHGSIDTVEILIAMKGPGIQKGKIVSDPSFERNYRISDIAMTLAKRLDLELLSSTVGRERTADLEA